MEVQYPTPVPPAGNRSADNHSLARGPCGQCLLLCRSHLAPSCLPPRGPAIRRSTWKSLGPACNKGWEASLPGEAARAVGSASPSRQLPQTPRSPPACPAASHAKDNSNSPLGLSQWLSAIDGEMGSPASPLMSLFYIQVCFLPPFRFLLAHSLLKEAPVFQKLREGGQSPLKIPKMFTVLGAEPQGSGLTSCNQRVRQALLTATPIPGLLEEKP